MGSGETAGAAKRDAAYFDQWYADMAVSSARDAIVARALGLPPELQSTSMLTWQGIAEVAEGLRMPRDGLLVDLACGRGGYGIEVARRTGARLLGVDFSGVALGQARLSSARLLPVGRLQFRPGTLTATGLPAAVADGLMCVDAVQFADPPLTALLEFRRLLAPGARLVLTCWEVSGSSDEQVSPRIRAVNLRRDRPASPACRCTTSPGGARPSGGCGRRCSRRRPTPTRRSGRCKPRADVRWRRSTRCAACSRRPPHPEPREGTRRPDMFRRPR
jgi:SAM-dependent methyltransferase